MSPPSGPLFFPLWLRMNSSSLISSAISIASANCKLHEIHYRELVECSLVLPQPGETQLEELFQRFEGETFGVRAGGPAQGGDAELEKELSRRGLDAYQPA